MLVKSVKRSSCFICINMYLLPYAVTLLTLLVYTAVAEAKESVVCEGATAYLYCNPGSKVSVTSASYGRSDRNTCKHPQMSDITCSAASSLPTVSSKCNGRQWCTVSATNSVFGDPCRHTYKYLRVSYNCVAEQSRQSIICEGGRRTLSCPGSSRIHITSANYGRTEGRKICPHSSIRTTNCHASNSLAKVKGLCHMKRSCTLFASNSVFGDPCVYTYKYLDVKYSCY